MGPARDQRSKSVGFEVGTSTDFKEKDTRSSDLKTIVGPIYSSGKIEEQRKHNFTRGYVEPMTRERRQEQQKLVQKYFQREKQTTDSLQQKIVDKAENLKKQYEPRAKSESRVDSRITREEALKLGEARRQEAIQRRQEFLHSETGSVAKKSTLQMSKQEKLEFQQERFVTQQQQTKEQIQNQQLSIAPMSIETLSQSSESSLQSSVKSRKQLEMERDEMIKQTMLQYQKESTSMAKRIKEEEEKRIQSIQTETLRIEEEYKARQEATKRVEEERKRKLEEEKRQAEEKQRLKVQEMQRSQELRKH